MASRPRDYNAGRRLCASRLPRAARAPILSQRVPASLEYARSPAIARGLTARAGRHRRPGCTISPSRGHAAARSMSRTVWLCSQRFHSVLALEDAVARRRTGCSEVFLARVVAQPGQRLDAVGASVASAQLAGMPSRCRWFVRVASARRVVWYCRSRSDGIAAERTGVDDADAEQHEVLEVTWEQLAARAGRCTCRYRGSCSRAARAVGASHGRTCGGGFDGPLVRPLQPLLERACAACVRDRSDADDQ